ncbi:hypothetical protein IQ07DRAFT_647190 [Pyrenochaeta sp. DS3sAY3a]|nr:hypothetical protein IQ07DRAFT_647190 [Pyrenochaeta sp. DS3sAY3a]
MKNGAQEMINLFKGFDTLTRKRSLDATGHTIAHPEGLTKRPGVLRNPNHCLPPKRQPSPRRGDLDGGEKKGKKATNVVHQFQHFVCVPEESPKPIQNLSTTASEAILRLFRAEIEANTTRKERYGRITRNPATYDDKRIEDCICSYLVNHGKSNPSWAHGDSDFACDACVKNFRPCVRMRPMTSTENEIHTENEDDSEEALNDTLYIVPLSTKHWSSQSWKDVGFWVAGEE